MQKQTEEEFNKDNHSISHLLIALVLIISLISLYFSINTFYTVKNYIDIETGKVQRTEVIHINTE